MGANSACARKHELERILIKIVEPQAAMMANALFLVNAEKTLKERHG
jgi:hypothetical protein